MASYGSGVNEPSGLIIENRRKRKTPFCARKSGLPAGHAVALQDWRRPPRHRDARRGARRERRQRGRAFWGSENAVGERPEQEDPIGCDHRETLRPEERYGRPVDPTRRQDGRRLLHAGSLLPSVVPAPEQAY